MGTISYMDPTGEKAVGNVLREQKRRENQKRIVGITDIGYDNNSSEAFRTKDLSGRREKHG